MTNWSKKWDEREKKDKEKERKYDKTTNPINNWKILVLVGIVLFALMFMVAFINMPYYQNDIGFGKPSVIGVTNHDGKQLYNTNSVFSS